MLSIAHWESQDDVNTMILQDGNSAEFLRLSTILKIKASLYYCHKRCVWQCIDLVNSQKLKRKKIVFDKTPLFPLPTGRINYAMCKCAHLFNICNLCRSLTELTALTFYNSMTGILLV